LHRNSGSEIGKRAHLRFMECIAFFAAETSCETPYARFLVA